MARRKAIQRKDPNRVKAGKKAWLTRLERKRDEEIGEAGASLIPGYGQVSHISKAIKAQEQLDKAKRKKTAKRK
jgi:hypothetical protein